MDLGVSGATGTLRFPDPSSKENQPLTVEFQVSGATGTLRFPDPSWVKLVADCVTLSCEARPGSQTPLIVGALCPRVSLGPSRQSFIGEAYYRSTPPGQNLSIASSGRALASGGG